MNCEIKEYTSDLLNVIFKIKSSLRHDGKYHNGMTYNYNINSSQLSALEEYLSRIELRLIHGIKAGRWKVQESNNCYN